MLGVKCKLIVSGTWPNKEIKKPLTKVLWAGKWCAEKYLIWNRCEWIRYNKLLINSLKRKCLEDLIILCMNIVDLLVVIGRNFSGNMCDASFS